MRAVQLFSLSTAYYFVTHFYREKQLAIKLREEEYTAKLEEAQMQVALASAQNELLRAQINPHFLFNTLDYIRYNVGKISKENEDAILLLADMMRYSTSIADADQRVSLGDEVDQVNRFLNLHQLRQKTPLEIDLYVAEDLGHFKVTPFLLLPLVECVVNFGELHDQDQKALIAIYQLNNLIKFQIEVAIIEAKRVEFNKKLEELKERVLIDNPDCSNFTHHHESSKTIIIVEIPKNFAS